MERAELDVARQQVDVHVGQTAGQRFACPESARARGVDDHLAERGRRHPDSSQILTCLHTQPPCGSRPEHGSTIATVQKGACGERLVIEGDVPSPMNPPPGCHVHTRRLYAVARCKSDDPPLQELSSGHIVARHLRTKETLATHA